MKDQSLDILAACIVFASQWVAAPVLVVMLMYLTGAAWWQGLVIGGCVGILIGGSRA